MESDKLVKQRSLMPCDPEERPGIDCLSLVPTSIFILICTYLDLVDKCRAFPSLNRIAAASFSPSTCCTKHDIAITIGSLKHRPSESIGQLPYLKYATSIKILDMRIDKASDDREIDPLLCPLEEAIRYSNLQSLHVQFGRDIRVVSGVLEVLARCSSKQLEHLTTLHISHQIKFNSQVVLRPQFALHHNHIPNRAPARTLLTSDWNGIANCSSLTDLSISLEGPHEAVSLDLLPRSLTRLKFFLVRLDDEFDAISQKLTEPDFLPHLQYLISPSVRANSILIQALSAVSNVTGKRRPIRALNVTYSPTLDLSTFDGLRELEIAIDSLQLVEAGAMLLSLPTTCMRYLERISVSIGRYAPEGGPLQPFGFPAPRMGQMGPPDAVGPLDLSWLFLFASSRSVKHFGVSVAWSPEAMWFSRKARATIRRLSFEAVRALFCMKPLETLKLACQEAEFQSQDLFGRDLNGVEYQLSKLPNLTRLELEGPIVTKENTRALLAASPSLKHLQSSIVDHFEPLTRLLHIDRCCPVIETVTSMINSRLNSQKQHPRLGRLALMGQQTAIRPDQTMPPSAADMLTVFHSQNASLKHLKEFRFEVPVEVNVLHLLVSKLMHAPQLHILQMRTCGIAVNIRRTNDIMKSCSITYFTILIKLRLPHLKSLSSEEYQAICHVEQSSLTSPAQSVSCFVMDPHSTDSVSFRTMYDYPPLDGRQKLLDLVQARLSDDERQILMQWDAGEYTVPPDPRAAVLRIDVDVI